GQGLAGHGLGGLGQGGLVPGAHDDLGPLLAEGLGGGAAEALGRRGHQGHLALQAQVHRFGDLLGQDQLRVARCRQYWSGGSARAASSSSSAAWSSTWGAARLDSSWAGVTAPERTTSAQGLARTAARATASTPTSWVAAMRARAWVAGSRPWGVRRPLATASLTVTPQPAWPASARAGPAEGSSRFQVAWTQAKGALP